MARGATPSRRPSALQEVRRAASELSDTAAAVERAADERAIVLRLPTMLARWSAFRTAVRDAGQIAVGSSPAPRDSPDPEPAEKPENTIEHWEAALRSLTMRASAAGFNVTYDVWAARVAGQGGDDG